MIGYSTMFTRAQTGLPHPEAYLHIPVVISAVQYKVGSSVYEFFYILLLLHPF